ncbi:MAG: hypothetical protein AABY18_03190 [Candidatus Thermoplasmatota archaeon]
MPGKTPVLAWFALAAAAGLAGCFFDGGQCYDMPAVASVKSDAPTTVGSEETDVAVQVLAMGINGSRPLAGAQVVAAWALPVHESVADGEDAAVRALRDGHRVQSSERYVLVFARLRTDAAGEAHLHIPSNAVLRVAATAAGHTVEHSEQVGYEGSLPHSIAVPLYPARMDFEVKGTLPTGVNAPTQSTRGPSSEFHWLEGPGHAQMQVRLTRLSLGLSWENTPTADSDLGIGAGGTQDDLAVSDNGANEAGRIGPQHVDAVGTAEEEWDEWPAVFAWPTQGTSLRLDPMPYTLTVTGEFAGTGDLEDVCLPSDYVVHGPLDVAEYEAVASESRGLGAGTFLMSVFAVALGAVLVGRLRR